MQYCPHCGAENTDRAKFCATCGRSLTAPAQIASVGPAASGAAPYSPPAPPSISRQPTLALQSLLHGRYLVHKLLDGGGMGAVYLAEDTQVFNRLCVVKEMLPYFTTPAERQQAEQNFEREARLLANLRHPGIPQLYDYFIENNNYYLVMEWVEGETLEKRLARQGKPLLETDVLEYAQQLAGILDYMARQNPPVIHRDIKPANVIGGDDGQVKLVDFGIAKTAAPSPTGKSIILGTPGYAPPEQYSGQVEPRTDIYALGATLHHLLTGRDPGKEALFQFPPVRQLAPWVSPELEKLIAEMLNPDPVFRPTAAQLRVRLESLLTSGGTAPSFQPFVFRSGAIAGNLHELAAACDRYWDEAVEHLYNGDFETWLVQFNRPDLANRAASIKRRGGDPSAGLEEFIRAIDHTMLMPALAVAPNIIDLGTIERGEKRTVTVQMMNASRGYLYGEIKNSVAWVRVTPRSFGLRENQQTTLTVTVDTSALNEGPAAVTILQITSNGGQVVIALKANVTWQPKLEVEPAGKLDFGAVMEGQPQPVTALFTVRNAGGGLLAGQLTASVPWIRFDQDRFSLTSGGSIDVTATAEPVWLGMLTVQEGTIHITSSAGNMDKPVLVRVQKPWYTGRARVLAWLLYGLTVLLGYIGAAVPSGVALALLLGWQRPAPTILAALGLLAILSPVAFIVSKRWVPRLDEIEDFHHRGRLADDLLPSRFSVQKTAWLSGALALLGGLLGWRFGELRPHDTTILWALAGAVVGGLAGGLLAAEGGGGPALLSGFWRGATLATSPTYAVMRTVFLLMAGALFGLLAGARIPPAGIRPENAVAGALIGLLMSSESHRWLTLRLRWLLMQVRLGAWMILGAYSLLSLLSLLRRGIPWTLLPYGYIGWRFTSISDLIWLTMHLAAAIAGALAGLWAAEGAGQPWHKAPRLFVGLIGIQLASSLPVYVLLSLLTGSIRDARLHMWINLLAVLAAAAGVAWAVRFRRVQVEMALARIGNILTAGWDRISALMPTVLQIARRRLFGAGFNLGTLSRRLHLPQITLPGVATLGRWRAALAALTLAELSAEMTPSLALGATGTAAIAQYVLANLVAELLIGIGLVLFRALLIVLFLIALMLIVRYIREHH
jgi:tRNA A-37 threonylcarbamoyl transferase component Bud32